MAKSSKTAAPDTETRAVHAQQALQQARQFAQAIDFAVSGAHRTRLARSAAEKFQEYAALLEQGR